MSTSRACSLLGLGFLSLVGVGCSASGPAFEPVTLQGEQAVVYVYRPGQSYAGSAVILPVKVDGEEVGGLINNAHTYKVLSPGKHEVSCCTEAKATVPFEVQSGRSYYIEAEVEMGLFLGRPKLTMVPEESGKLAILGTRSVHRSPRGG